MALFIQQLLLLVAPPILQIILDHQAANGGATPTLEQLQATLRGNVGKYLAEGAAWTASHPPTP